MRIYPIALLCLSLAACGNDGAPASGQADTPANAETPAIAEAPVAVAEPAPTPALEALTAEQAVVTPVLSEACNMELVDGVLVPDGNPIAVKSPIFDVSGWAFDEVAKALPGKLAVRVYSTSGDGKIWQVNAVQASERKDVADLHPEMGNILKSGFQARLDTTGFPAGRYSLRLAYDRAGQEVLCDNGRSITIK